MSTFFLIGEGVNSLGVEFGGKIIPMLENIECDTFILSGVFMGNGITNHGFLLR